MHISICGLKNYYSNLIDYSLYIIKIFHNFQFSYFLTVIIAITLTIIVILLVKIIIILNESNFLFGIIKKYQFFV